MLYKLEPQSKQYTPDLTDLVAEHEIDDYYSFKQCFVHVQHLSTNVWSRKNDKRGTHNEDTKIIHQVTATARNLKHQKAH